MMNFAKESDFDANIEDIDENTSKPSPSYPVSNDYQTMDESDLGLSKQDFFKERFTLRQNSGAT